MTEFSAFALQFLPFTHFIWFCFNLSSNHVNTKCKVSSLGREDIGRMWNLRLDCCLYYWKCSRAFALTLVHPLHYFWKYSSSGGTFYGIMRWPKKQNKTKPTNQKNPKLINACRTRSHKASAAAAHGGFHTTHQLTLHCPYGRQAAQP